jgi:hypothetical protein
MPFCPQILPKKVSAKVQFVPSNAVLDAETRDLGYDKPVRGVSVRSLRSLQMWYGGSRAMLLMFKSCQLKNY